VVRGDVQQLEVELLGLDLGPLEDLEPIRVEDLAEVQHERLARVEVADAHRPPGCAHVQGLGCELRLQIRLAEHRESLVDGCLDLATHLVRPLAHRRPALRGHGSQLAQEAAQPAGAAQQLAAQRLERQAVPCRAQPLTRLVAKRLDLPDQVIQCITVDIIR
jgi:hypothetical protein